MSNSQASESNSDSLPPFGSKLWPEGYFVQSIKDMVETSIRLEVWEWFKTEEPPEDEGYQWWDHPNINLISSNLSNNDHSGASFACAMRNVQYIAKNGFTAWKKKYIENTNT